MIFAEHFTLSSALKVMTPMEIVVNYEAKDLIGQLYKHAAEIDISNFIADVTSEYEEIKEIIDTFITTCACIGWAGPCSTSFLCPKCGSSLTLIEGAVKHSGTYINYWLECVNIPEEGFTGCSAMFLPLLDEESYVIGIGEEIDR